MERVALRPPPMINQQSTGYDAASRIARTIHLRTSYLSAQQLANAMQMFLLDWQCHHDSVASPHLDLSGPLACVQNKGVIIHDQTIYSLAKGFFITRTRHDLELDSIVINLNYHDTPSSFLKFNFKLQFDFPRPGSFLPMPPRPWPAIHYYHPRYSRQ